MNAIEIWRTIGHTPPYEPLPAEVRAYQLEVSARLDQLIVDCPELPEEAAKLVPKALWYTGEAIKVERDRRRATKFAVLFELRKAGQVRGEVKPIAEDLAKKARIKRRSLYDWWNNHTPANIRELAKAVAQGRRSKVRFGRGGKTAQTPLDNDGAM